MIESDPRLEKRYQHVLVLGGVLQKLAIQFGTSKVIALLHLQLRASKDEDFDLHLETTNKDKATSLLTVEQKLQDCNQLR